MREKDPLSIPIKGKFQFKLFLLKDETKLIQSKSILFSKSIETGHVLNKLIVICSERVNNPLLATTRGGLCSTLSLKMKIILYFIG